MFVELDSKAGPKNKASATLSLGGNLILLVSTGSSEVTLSQIFLFDPKTKKILRAFNIDDIGSVKEMTTKEIDAAFSARDEN